MKRILLMVCRNIFIVPWLYLKLCWYASHTNSIPVEKKMALLKTIVGYANRGGNVEIKAYGVEKYSIRRQLYVLSKSSGTL